MTTSNYFKLLNLFNLKNTSYIPNMEFLHDLLLNGNNSFLITIDNMVQYIMYKSKISNENP